MRLRRAWLWFLAVPACATPYQPATLDLPMLPDAATEGQLLAVFLRYFPRVEPVAYAPLRVRSTWSDGAPVGDTPVQDRASLVVTPRGTGALLEVVVERQVLRSDPFGLPAWHAVGAHPALEERLVRELGAALGLLPPADPPGATAR